MLPCKDIQVSFNFNQRNRANKVSIFCCRSFDSNREGHILSTCDAGWWRETSKVEIKKKKQTAAEQEKWTTRIFYKKEGAHYIFCLLLTWKTRARRVKAASIFLESWSLHTAQHNCVQFVTGAQTFFFLFRFGFGYGRNKVVYIGLPILKEKKKAAFEPIGPAVSAIRRMYTREQKSLSLYTSTMAEEKWRCYRLYTIRNVYKCFSVFWSGRRGIVCKLFVVEESVKESFPALSFVFWHRTTSFSNFLIYLATESRHSIWWFWHYVCFNLT